MKHAVARWFFPLALVVVCTSAAKADDASCAALTGMTTLSKPSDLVNCASISKFSPRARADVVCTIASQWAKADAAEINNELRIQHFFSEIAGETSGMTILSENMNYSVEDIRRVFKKRVNGPTAAKLAHHPVDLADYVYNGRNGNHATGNDGWMYRGGGLIQLTGRGNYRDRGHDLGLGSKLEDNPELLRAADFAFSTAYAYWKFSGAKSAADRDDAAGVRQAINGGQNGIASVRIWLAQAKKVFKLKQPSESETVLNAEQKKAVIDRLIELGFLGADANLSPLSDEVVTAALKNFQEEFGLEQTGILDEDTLYAITDPKITPKD